MTALIATYSSSLYVRNGPGSSPGYWVNLSCWRHDAMSEIIAISRSISKTRAFKDFWPSWSTWPWILHEKQGSWIVQNFNLLRFKISVWPWSFRCSWSLFLESDILITHWHCPIQIWRKWFRISASPEKTRSKEIGKPDILVLQAFRRQNTKFIKNYFIGIICSNYASSGAYFA